MTKGTVNKLLPGGVRRFSKSRMFAKKALYKKKRVVTKVEKKRDFMTKIKQIGGEKNGGTRKVRIQKLVSCYQLSGPILLSEGFS